MTERRSRSRRGCATTPCEFRERPTGRRAGRRAQAVTSSTRTSGACTRDGVLAGRASIRDPAACRRGAQDVRHRRVALRPAARARRYAQRHGALCRRRHHAGRHRVRRLDALSRRALGVRADDAAGAGGQLHRRQDLLNHGRYKNLVGTMYPPERVIVDHRFLATLSRERLLQRARRGRQAARARRGGRCRRLAGGHGAVAARASTRRFAPRWATACASSSRYIEDDEFDRGRRNLLNFGHCFGHAIEAATAFAVPHGQAVVLGMLLAEAVAARRGLLGADAPERARDALFLPGAQRAPRSRRCRGGRGGRGMRHDKKRTGAGLALVMCGDDFRMLRVDDLSETRPRRARRARSGGERGAASARRASGRYREPSPIFIVGAWNTLFGYAVFALLYYLLRAHLHVDVILVISYALSIANAYVGYRFLVFRSTGQHEARAAALHAVYVVTSPPTWSCFRSPCGCCPGTSTSSRGCSRS